MADQTATPKKKNRATTALVILSLVFLPCCLLRFVVLRAYEIDGPAMEPTLFNGDRVAARPWGTPQPGDVVFLRSPADQIDVVKRIVGVGGDRIEIRDDEVFRNGRSIRRRARVDCVPSDQLERETICQEERLGERTWETCRDPSSPPDSMAEVTVPRDHFFVLGDHRDRSNDSRNVRVGMIPRANIHGPAWFIYWSNDGDIRWDRVGMSVR